MNKAYSCKKHKLHRKRKKSEHNTCKYAHVQPACRVRLDTIGALLISTLPAL